MFFQYHDYLEKMNSRIATNSLKGKEKIWWEDVKDVIGILKEDLTWSEFKILFMNMYLYESYSDDKEKEFYELKKGSMTDEKYTRKLFEFLKYVPYLNEEKENT